MTSTSAVQNAAAIRAAADARARSAVSASTYTVPSGFLWLLDFMMLSGALLVAWRLAPHLQQLISAETAERIPWLSGLELLPAAQAAGQVGQANALAGGLGNVMNTYTLASLLNQNPSIA